MKRPTLLLLSVLCLGLAPADAATLHRPPVLSGDNIIHATGSRAVLVRIPRRVEVEYRLPRPEWFTSFSTTGSYAGFALQEARPRGGLRQVFFYMVLAGSVGCPVPGSAAAMLTYCRPQYTQSAKVRNVTLNEMPERMRLEPGDYFVYALTDPSKKVTVRFRLPGLSGSTVTTAGRPVGMQLRHVAKQETQGTAVITETFSGKVAGEGLVGGGVWSTGTLRPRNPLGTPLTPEANLFAVQSCFRSDEGDGWTPCLPLADETWTADRLFDWPDSAARRTWSVTFTEVMPPGGRVGAFAFWLTFLRP